MKNSLPRFEDFSLALDALHAAAVENSSIPSAISEAEAILGACVERSTSRCWLEEGADGDDMFPGKVLTSVSRYFLRPVNGRLTELALETLKNSACYSGEYRAFLGGRVPGLFEMVNRVAEGSLGVVREFVEGGGGGERQ